MVDKTTLSYILAEISASNSKFGSATLIPILSSCASTTNRLVSNATSFAKVETSVVSPVTVNVPDIARSFDGLNDIRNLKLSIEYAKKAGMISQSCLCITHSKIHTVDYYINLAKELIELGTDEIAIKDMAGIGRPSSLGKIVKGIKKYNPNIIISVVVKYDSFMFYKVY